MIQFTLNGERVQVDAPADEPLLWVLRDDLGSVGTRYGCGAGLCGSCTVHVDGVAARSCQLPVTAVEGRSVVTVDGPAPAGSALHAVRAAFLEYQVPQCGYCMSGWQMALAARLQTEPEASDEALLAGLDANLCRCGTYVRIRRASLAAAEAYRRAGTGGVRGRG